MDFSKERSKLLELKAEYCLDQTNCGYAYKQGPWNVIHVSDYVRGKQEFKMINLLLEWGKIGYFHSYDCELGNCDIDLSKKEEKFIRKYGIEAVYNGLQRYDWLMSCFNMGLRDDIYGHMVKSRAFKNIRDEKVRNWTIMGLLAGYAHIAPKDPMIEKILSEYDEESAPTNFVKLEQSRGLKNLENGKWEEDAKYFHYLCDCYGHISK